MRWCDARLRAIFCTQDIVSVVLLSFAVTASLVVLVAIWKLDNKNKLRSRILMALFASHIWARYLVFDLRRTILVIDAVAV